MDALISFDTVKNSFITVKDNYLNLASDSTLPDKYRAYSELNRDIIKQRIKFTLKVYATDVQLYNSSEFRNKNSIDKQMNYLKKIIAICNEKGIPLYLYISPVYAEHYALIKKNLGDTFHYWKQEIANITSYYDFTGSNSITTDLNLYTDSHHVQPYIGKLIFARIFNDKSVSIPDNFGILIRKNSMIKIQ